MIEKINQKETVSGSGNADFRAKNFTDDLFEQSDEYANGRKRLDYSCSFLKGEVLAARENDNGIAKIIISRDGRTLVDFRKFIDSRGYVFVTPRWLMKNKMGEYAYAGYSCFCSKRLIAIGEFKDIRHIFAVLHEIGHARTGHGPIDSNMMDLWRSKNDPGKSFSKIEAKHFISQVSAEERGAWAEALRIAREIKKDSAVDLFGVFAGKKEFRDFIYGLLVSHRISQGKKFSAVQESFLETAFRRLKDIFGLDAPENDDDEKFLDKLFDKRRLWRVAEEVMDEKSA